VYKYYNKQNRVKINNDLPPSLPKRVALLYQTRIKLEVVKHGNLPELTVLFLNKHLNGKKLSSHMWFFEGFCRLLHPKYCVFIDVGTVPSETGIFKYFCALEGDKNIGGVSGYMGLYFEEQSNEEKEEEKRQK